MSLATEPFKLYNTYYDLLYKDKDYKKEATYVHKLIQKHSPGAQHILELGSGTGNYSQPLSEAGYKITGIELNEEMNEIARSKSISNFTAVTGNIVSFDLVDQFDAVVALFHVISYLNNNNEILSCFKQVAKHLKPEGIFIFDVWFTPAVYTQLPEARIREVENESFLITRKAYPIISYQENTVTVNYELTIRNKEDNVDEVLHESHCMRHFSKPEMELIAEMCGLALLQTEEFLTAKEPGKDTWGVCYILKKHE